jgi:hypothetical protein
MHLTIRSFSDALRMLPVIPPRPCTDPLHARGRPMGRNRRARVGMDFPRLRRNARSISCPWALGSTPSCASGKGAWRHSWRRPVVPASRFYAIQRRRDRPPMWPYCKLFVCHEEPGTEPGIFRKYLEKTCSNYNAVSILIRLSPSPPNRAITS